MILYYKNHSKNNFRRIKNILILYQENICYFFIWQTKVEGVDNEPIKKYCYEMRDKTEGVVISNRGGWHSKEILQLLR